MAAACERARGCLDSRLHTGSAPLDRRNRRVLVVRTKKNGEPDEADAAILRRAYRQPVRSGKLGRPPLVVPPEVRLTQTIKHRDEHGKLLSVEIPAVLGGIVSEPGTVHIERVNGTLRDRPGALTRHPACLCETRCHVGCAGRLAALRSSLPSGSSGPTAPVSGGSASVSTAVSGSGSGVDGSSLVIPGMADLPYSSSPFIGSLPAFSPRRLPLAHPPGLLQPRKPQPARLSPALVGGLALACSTLAHSSPARAASPPARSRLSASSPPSPAPSLWY